jgi:hypothetical protein
MGRGGEWAILTPISKPIPRGNPPKRLLAKLYKVWRDLLFLMPKGRRVNSVRPSMGMV